MINQAKQFVIAGICLVLIIVAASLSWLRIGVQQHPLYHGFVEQQVSQAIGTELRLAGFEMKLVGTSLELQLQGLKTLAGQKLDQISLGVDLLDSFNNKKLSVLSLKASGIDVMVAQQPDGSWSNASPSSNSANQLLSLAGSLPQLILDDVRLTLLPNAQQALVLPSLDARIGLEQQLGADKERDKLTVALYQSSQNNEDAPELKLHLSLELQHGLGANEWSLEAIEGAKIYLNAAKVDANAWAEIIAPKAPSLFNQSVNLSGEYWFDYQSIPTKEQLNPSQQWRLAGHLSNGRFNDLSLPVSKFDIRKTNGTLFVYTPKLDLGLTQQLLGTIERQPQKLKLPILSLAPTGMAYDAQLKLDLSQPKEFLFTSAVQQASVNTWAGVPDIRNLDGQLWLNRYGGKVSIDDTNGLSIGVTKLVENPWELKALTGELNWRYGPKANQVASSNMKAALDEGEVNLALAGLFPRKGSSVEPFLQLALGMKNINLAKFPSLLPTKVMGPALGDWVAGAAPVGQIEEAGLIYNGRPGKLPDSASKFARSMPVEARVSAPFVSYHSKWPKVADLKANIEATYDKAWVNVTAGQTSFDGMTQDLSGFQIEVPIYPVNLSLKSGAKKDGFIKINGDLSGAADKLISAVQKAPMNLQLPHWLKALNPEGEVSIEGSLAIAFGHKAKVKYDLNLSSANLSAQFEPLKANLRQFELQVGLNSKQAGLGDIMGNGLVDGQRVSFKRLSQAQVKKPWLTTIPNAIALETMAPINESASPIIIQLEGRLPKHYLASKLETPWAHEIPGPLPFSARLSMCPTTNCSVLSAKLDLSMAQIGLPAPFDKPQELQLMGSLVANPQHWYATIDEHHMAVNLGSSSNSDGNSLLGLNLGFDKPVMRADKGDWEFSGAIDYVDIEPWWLVYQQRIKPFLANEGGSKTTLPRPSVDLLVKQAAWGQLAIDQSQFKLESFGTPTILEPNRPWRFNIDSTKLKGQIDYIDPESALLINIDHALLSFPESQDEAEENASENEEKQDLLENIDPKQLVDADVVIKDLQKNGEPFGRWAFKIRREADQAFVHDLEADIRNARLQGNLIWDRIDGVHRTQFTGRGETDDMAKMLTAWGYSPALSAETAALEVQLDWPRSPLAFRLKETSGDLGLRLKKGTVAANANAAQGLKVLALFDVGRLINRVKLDFSDIIQPGFNYDSVKAHYKFEKGFASTVTPSTFKSSTLNLSLDGFIDFKNREVDNNLVVTLPVAEKLPLAALIAGLPQLSGMIYVVNKLIGDELATVTSARYQVVGSLDNPDVNLVRYFDKDYEQQTVQERIENVITID